MHAGQVDIGADVVAGLVASQFPRWADLPVRPLPSHGTVNALFRLGQDYVLRFPLCPAPGLRAELAAEQDRVRLIGPHVSVAVPGPVALGAPGAGYDGPWSVYRWIPGVTADTLHVGDSDAFVDDLAVFVRAVHGIDTFGRRWAGSGRGGPLAQADADVQQSLAASRGLVDVDVDVDVDAVARAWERCRDVPRGPDPDVWIHADLMPGNLIVRIDRLAAVIDFGAVTIGDPAVDLLPAWTLLTPRTRARYRAALDVDDAQWERGRGWAIVQAIVALHYYVHTNPMMATIARRTLDAVTS